MLDSLVSDKVFKWMLTHLLKTVHLCIYFSEDKVCSRIDGVFGRDDNCEKKKYF